MNHPSGPPAAAASTGRSEVVAVLLAGFLIGTVTLVASVSFAALIFSGRLAPEVGRGVGIALFTAIVSGLAVAWLSSCRRAIAIPQDRVAPVLALMAAHLAATLPASAAPQEVAITVAAAIALTTLLTGVFLMALGLFRVGGLIRFLPYSVVGGFLAGTGWLLVLGGLRVMTGASLAEPAEAAVLLEPAMIARWLPGLGIALGIALTVARMRHALALPAVLLLATAGFYLATFAMGLATTDLTAEGWLLGPLAGDGTRLWQPLSPAELARVDWAVIGDSLGSIGTVLLLSAVSILLTVSALELMARRDLDVDRELRACGLANLASGLGGGMVAFHSLSLSGLAIQLGARSRWVGVVSALVCAIGLWAGPDLVGYLPRPVLGALLAALGLAFVYEWLIRSWSRLPRSEYAMIALIVLVMVTFGFLAGMAVGLVAAVALFVLNYSRIDVVRYALSGRRRKSTVERHPTDERLLREHGSRIYVLALQGYLFFGTTRRLQRYLEQRAADAEREPLRFAVLDFKQVTGIDPSAIHVFSKIARLAKNKSFELVVTHIGEVFRRQIRVGAVEEAALQSLQFFPDLDHGLEWCEERMLQGLSAADTQPAPTVLAEVSRRLPDQARRDTFEGYLERLVLPAGHTLITQGEPSDDLYFVEEGTVSVYLTTRDGSPIRLRRTGPGTVVGELGFYLHVPRSASVTTDAKVTAYRLSAAALRRMETAEPVIAATFHRYMAELSAERLLLTTQTLEVLWE